MRKLIMTIVMILMVAQVYAATAILTCNVGGATLEYQSNEDPVWRTSAFPKVLACRRNEYILVKVTAAGYETFEQGFDIEQSGMNTIAITLQPEVSDPTATPLFGIAGQIVSRSGATIYPNTYRVLCRNVTNYSKLHAPQVSQDINYNGDAGSFSGVFADLATNRAAAVGDKVVIMVMNSSMTRVYGYSIKILNEDDVLNAGIFATILIR